jgi:hypothetical protein
VDEDGAADFVMLMGEEYIQKYHNADADRTEAVRTYLSMGIVAPAHASIGRWQAIAQRTQWMQRQNLVGEVQRERLLEILEEQRAQGVVQQEEPEVPAQAPLFEETDLVDLEVDESIDEEEEERAPAPMG